MKCLDCELTNLLDVLMPPDPELVGFIEQAFLEGQIDDQKSDLAYTYLYLEASNRYCMNIQ